MELLLDKYDQLDHAINGAGAGLSMTALNAARAFNGMGRSLQSLLEHFEVRLILLHTTPTHFTPLT